MNPNISVIGNLGLNWGDDSTISPELFGLKEAELGFQAVVDPYARGDFFIAVDEEGASIEEGYITFLALPGGLSIKAGKFRSNIGKFNRTHPPETVFADRPLATVEFLGEDGLSGIGASASYLVPLSSLYLNLDFEVTNNFNESPSFGYESDGELVAGGKRGDLGYTLRASTYRDLTESSNIAAGFSYVRGVNDASGLQATNIYNTDVTLRWKNPRRAIYRSFMWQTEVLVERMETQPGSTVSSWGMFSYVDFQFSRRWHTGARFDQSERPGDASASERGGLAYITFTPSEFSLLSFQSRYVKRFDGKKEWAHFVKLTFNIGPHGAHPF
ncbi:MAG: hypothetical protein AB1714_11270 [Acidobacteriota bacterium]